MQNIIIIEREHVPVEQIAYIEPFETPANGQFKPEKAYKGRVVLINRETVLTEDTPQAFAEANEFRLLPEDNVATNPLISFRVRSFAPSVDYNPTKPYQTRFMWRDPNGDNRSKLLLTKPRNGDRDRPARRNRTRSGPQGPATSPGSATWVTQAGASRGGIKFVFPLTPTNRHWSW